LINLLSKASNCSDSELWNFIQELEKCTSFISLQSEVEIVLSKLKCRWDNLTEEEKLSSYWNDATTSFDKWLEEAEDLKLNSDDPFFNFKEDIKKEKSKEKIEEKKNEVFLHILVKFKAKVKEELGLQQQSNEYLEIDNAENLETVKAARKIVFQQRQNQDSPSSPENEIPQDSPEDNNKNEERDKEKKDQKTLLMVNTSSNLAPKIVTGIVFLVAGSVAAMVFIKTMQKKKHLNKVRK